MLTREDDIDVHALHRQGWTISAIARHLGHDRKTIRAYLSGATESLGSERRRAPDPFEPFVDYVGQAAGRGPAPVGDDAVRRGRSSWGSTGRIRRSPAQLRARGLRPACEPCRPAKGRAGGGDRAPAG